MFQAAFAALGILAAPARVGIVTMTTPDIEAYANVTELHNRRYADRWGYGFHAVDHAIDRKRVPHWSKLHAVQLFLPEYDFLLWIDADAVFFDHSLRIEDVMGIEQQRGRPSQGTGAEVAE